MRTITTLLTAILFLAAAKAHAFKADGKYTYDEKESSGRMSVTTTATEYTEYKLVLDSKDSDTGRTCTIKATGTLLMGTGSEVSVKFQVNDPYDSSARPTTFIGRFYPNGAILEDEDTARSWCGMNTTFTGGWRKQDDQAKSIESVCRERIKIVKACYGKAVKGAKLTKVSKNYTSEQQTICSIGYSIFNKVGSLTLSELEEVGEGLYEKCKNNNMTK